VQLEHGNMWDVFHDTDIFMITTNPIRRKDGAVVMGRGIAKEAKDRYPELPHDFGQALQELHPEVDQFCVGPINVYEGTPIWFFMVKDHWRNKASLQIIQQSVFYLKHGFVNLDQKRIDLNFPGIGNGGLTREEVLPLLQELPDNVHIWEKA
jgi:hypothetical protein